MIFKTKKENNVVSTLDNLDLCSALTLFFVEMFECLLGSDAPCRKYRELHDFKRFCSVLFCWRSQLRSMRRIKTFWLMFIRENVMYSQTGLAVIMPVGHPSLLS